MSSPPIGTPAIATLAQPLISTRRLELAEHLRLPYSVPTPGPHDLEASGSWSRIGVEDGPGLYWPSESSLTDRPRFGQVDGVPDRDIWVFARMLADSEAPPGLAETAGAWSRVLAVLDGAGRRVASVWRDDRGNVALPFDPDEVLLSYRSERYLQHLPWASGVRSMVGSYYRIRGLLPRSAQIWLRRRYARRQGRIPIPRWPVEPAQHDFLDLVLAILSDVCDQPLPYLAPWPNGHSWALVLTHDVETGDGLAAMDGLLAVERRFGVRSAWNLVPGRRYHVDQATVQQLLAEGFEVGVHGLHHDGRDLSSLAWLRARLPGMRSAAERWNATGFRSPSCLRQWELMPMLGFDHDSSYPDTDPYEPQPGGCCTWWPFFNRDLVELPLTMPQDHTLFVILQHTGPDTWLAKAEFLRRRGGMVLLDTHPGYLEPTAGLKAYEAVLERYADDSSGWKALPSQVSAWWRRRAATTLHPGTAGWSMSGPAADEARIEFAGRQPWC